MNSPTQRLAQSSPYFHIALYAAGNVLAVAILLLVWFSWGILAAFQEPLLWAWLCSLSLRDVKRFLVSTARRELLSSSFVVCCAKLVFLPAVIAWQLFEEVRDKLQAKYHELQVNSQAEGRGPAAAPAGAGSPYSSSAALNSDSQAADATADAAHALNGHASVAAAAPAGDTASGAAGEGAGVQLKTRGSQVLRQRKASGKHQQQQQQQQQQGKYQRPPLGPRSNSALVPATAAPHKPGVQSAGPRPKAAGAAGAKGGGRQAQGRKQAAPAKASCTASAWQQRLLRLQDFFKQLFSGYGFITMELLRFVLGGLLPRRSSLDQQQQQRQQQQQQRQQQQQQQLWQAGASSSNGTLSTLASLQGSQMLSGLPTYLDLQVGANSYRASATDSLGDSSYPGSCRSECNMPWAPHPHLQQLYLQQQQQQQQQGLVSLGSHQQQQQKRLSSSSSSPSLQSIAAASRQPSPRGLGGTADGAGSFGLEQNMTGPAAGTGNLSLGGWASLQQQQQQQGQGQWLSHCDSITSCATSQTVPAATPAAAATGSIYPSSQAADSLAITSSAPVQQQYSTAGPTLSQHQLQYPAQPGAAYSLPSPMPAFQQPSLATVPVHAASLGGPLGHLPDPMLLPAASLGAGLGGGLGAGLGGGLGAGCCEGSSGGWEGLMPGRSPAGSVTGGTSGSSPSAVLFKGLLRGIVLYEGYRFVRGFLAAEQSLFMPLLLLGATLAVAGGLPFLLLPASLLKSSANGSSTDEQQEQLSDHADSAAASEHSAKAAAAAAAAASRRRMRSPFYEAAGGKPSSSNKLADAAAAGASSNSSILLRVWEFAQQHCAVAWSRVVSVLVRTDTALRTACASSFLDTAVSGLIVVGLILGSVVLSAVLLVQIGDESRQAVVSLNTLVRQKGTEAGLTEGVWSLVQQYEGQLVGMTQYVLQETLPGLTHYVENRASDFLVSHNLSKVLIDWEVVRAALKLPADCGDEAKLRLAVQLANSSLAEAQLGQQRQQLQQQLDQQQKRLSMLAAELEAVWMNSTTTNASSSRSTDGSSSSGSSGVGVESSGSYGKGSSSSNNSSALSQEVLQVQADVERLHDLLHSAVLGHEAASEQLKLAELRMHNCQPTGAGSGAATTAAGLADAAQGRGLLASLLGGFTASRRATEGGNKAAGTSKGAVGHLSPSGHGMANPLSHVRGVLAAVARFDFAAAGSEVTAMLGQLMPEEGEDQQLAEADHHQQEQLQRQGVRQTEEQRVMQAADHSCGVLEGVGSGSLRPEQQQQQQQPFGMLEQCPTGTTCSADQALGDLHSNVTSSALAMTGGAKHGAAKVGSSSSGGASAGSSGSSTSTSLVRVARGAAYPLITLLRHVSSVVVAGLGSTTAVALGTGLGVLRLGLGVAKFLVQLGVFASVLYTLLALDIDPVEQLVKLLPVSEASQDRASRAVTKALRGVFVSSLKLAAFHAGFTWLTLRAFGTHFVCTATAASAIVAVLPLVPVYLTALPAVLECVLVRGAAVKGLVLLALHVGAYTFGDDLIYREIEPTLPYLVGLGVFGGMYNFANPLQGVLLGPMVLALLSVGYNLHREMY